MTKKLIPRLKRGKKLLKGQGGTPVVISRGEYMMTPEGKFVLRDPNGKWLYFDDMATRDSLSYEWYPFESTASESAQPIINGHLNPNREDPYYKKALESAEEQKKANKSEKKERGGIMKGLDDLDTSKIPGYGMLIEKIQNYNFTPEFKKTLEKIGPGTDAITKYDFIEAPKPKLLPRNIEVNDIVSGRDTTLIPSEVVEEIGPEIKLENKPNKYGLIKRRNKKHGITSEGNRFKNGGIVKGQNDLDTDTDIDSIQDPFERARLHNAREAEISRQYFNSTPSIGNLVRGAYHWWMSKPSLGGETGYVTGVAPIVGFAKGVSLAKLPTDLLSKWKALNLTSKSRELLEHYLENNSNSMGELSKAVRNLLLHPNIEKYSTIDIQPGAASSMVNGARSYKFKKLTREQRRDIRDYIPESYTRKSGKPSLFTDRKIKHTW